MLLFSRNSASPSLLQIPTKVTNSVIFNAENFWEKSLFVLGGQERTDLLGKQSKTEQWEITSEFKTSNNYSIRCNNKKFGSLLLKSEDGGSHGKSWKKRNI